MKKPWLNLALVLAALITMACSCPRHVYYSPPAQNVPMLKEKGELSAECGLTSGRIPQPYDFCEPTYTGGFYLQAAYSHRSNIGIAFNHMMVDRSWKQYSNSNGNVTDLEGSGRGFATDLGAGYYMTLERFGWLGKAGKYIQVEAYSGLGYSGQSHFYRDSAYSGSADLKALIFYVQPAIGVNLPWLTVSLSLRQNNFYFHRIRTSYPDNYPGSNYARVETDVVDYLQRHPFQAFIEPAFTIKMGWKHIKLSFQYCLSSGITGLTYVATEPQRFSLGLQINIAARYKKVKTLVN
ncbi:MAG: hypothetical protein AB1458_08480 [Bacteroidota bacterium]